MRQETPLISPRQDQIVRLVRSNGYMANEEMAQHFGVAVQTIRRDVTSLAGLGLLCRHHGGATPVSTVENLDYDARQILNASAKDAIGRYAASLIPDRSSLFINIGTTTEAFARSLTKHRDLRIVTNNLHVASLVSGRMDFHTVITGGQLRPQDGAILGSSAIESLSSFRTEFGVIGISGIEDDGTLLDFDLSEIQCARTIIRNSRRVLLLADHTKFSRHPMGRVGDLRDIDDLITDQPVPEAFQRHLDAAGVTLHVAENHARFHKNEHYLVTNHINLFLYRSTCSKTNIDRSFWSVMTGECDVIDSRGFFRGQCLRTLRPAGRGRRHQWLWNRKGCRRQGGKGASRRAG